MTRQPHERPSAAEPTVTDWRAVAVVVTSGVIVALQVGKGIITLPALRSDFALGLQAAGWVISVFAFLGVVGGIPAGVAVNRFGDRFLCWSGLLILAVGSLMSALAGSFALLLTGRIIEGLGFLLATVAAPALLQRIVAPPTATSSSACGALLCRPAWPLPFSAVPRSKAGAAASGFSMPD